MARRFQARTPRTARWCGWLASAARNWRGLRLWTSAPPTCYWVALRRGVFEAVGQLDEQSWMQGSAREQYARRVRDAGHQVSCAYSVLAHRFGERLDDHPEPADAALAQRVEAAVRQHVPAGVDRSGREPGGTRTLVASDGREVLDAAASSRTALAQITIRPGTRRQSPSSSGCASAAPLTWCCPRRRFGGSSDTGAFGIAWSATDAPARTPRALSSTSFPSRPKPRVRGGPKA